MFLGEQGASMWPGVWPVMWLPHLSLHVDSASLETDSKQGFTVFPAITFFPQYYICFQPHTERNSKLVTSHVS